MPTFTTERHWIEVVGYIWLPNNVICAQEIKIEKSEIEQIGELTRENVESWLGSHTGDFSEIVDFSPHIKDFEPGWKNEEHEIEYSDCMYSE